MFSKEELEHSFQILIQKAKFKRRIPMALEGIDEYCNPASVSILPIGSDGMKTITFLKNPEFHYREIIRKLKKHSENPENPYHFRPLRPIVKYTKSGKARIIFTYSLVDQIVLKAVHLELKKNWEYASVNTPHPMDIAIKIYEKIQQVGNGVKIIKTDISKFFPSINRDILFAKLKNENIRPEIIRLIIAANNSDKTSGIVTGGALSTMLSEFYVKNLSKPFPEDIAFFRFADDICLIIPPNYKATKIKSLLKEELKKLDLKISNDKTKTINPYLTNFEYLGITFEKGKPIIQDDELQYWKSKVVKDVFSEKNKLKLYKKLNPNLKTLYNSKQIQDKIWSLHFCGIRSRFYIKYNKYRKYFNKK